MTDEISVVEEYPHSCRIVENKRDDDYNQYHYEGPMGRTKTFENPDKARLYADVQTITCGFRKKRLVNGCASGDRSLP